MTAATAPAPPAPPAAPESTATGPTASSVWRRYRGPLLLVALLAVVAGIPAVLSAGRSADPLDPRSYTPEGSRAVAELLGDRGVDVRVVDTVDAALSPPGRGTTVVVPQPQLLTESELTRLARADVRLVVVGADDEEVSALEVPVRVGDPVDVDVRPPTCSLPVAERAGPATLGGTTYRTEGRATGCYAGSGRPTLVAVDDAGVTLLGTGAVLTNEALDEEGNAALALGVLGQGERVNWLLPDPSRPLPEGERPSLSDLVPQWLALAVVQGFVALAVLALWRARRLGRVVTEPLPVVVRAAEAAEGRSRLYRAAGARDRAAEQLRAGARERLARRIGLPAEASREALVEAVAERLRTPAAAVDDLLYGAAPVDDAALVRLADDLDSLAREVAGS